MKGTTPSREEESARKSRDHHSPQVVPVVATDAGACRELLLGNTTADKAIGSSGIITPVARPEATGRAIARLAQDPSLLAAMGSAGIKRVERFYRLEAVHSQYDNLYQRLAARGQQELAWQE